MSLNRLIWLAVVPLALSACDSQQPSYTAANPAPSAPVPASAPAPVVQAPAAVPAAASTPTHERQAHSSIAGLPIAPRVVIAEVEPIGIGGCDDFIQRFRNCMNSGTVKSGREFGIARVFRVQVQQWQADVKAGKTAEVATACSAADVKAREELSKAGCTTY